MFNVWKNNNKQTDIETLRKRANDNDMDAQYALSLAYYRGTGVAKDIKKSNYWLEKANEVCKAESYAI